MRKIFYVIIFLLGISVLAEAQTNKQDVVSGVSVDNLKIERSGEYIIVDMTLDLRQLDVESNRAVLLTPRLVNGRDSLDLQSVGVYGRRRYFYYVRNGVSMLTGEGEQTFKASKKPDEMKYHYMVSYADWMNGAKLSLYRSDYGCCNSVLDEQNGMLGQHVEEFFPELIYVRPEAVSVKTRSLEGSAFVDFPVDQTVIYDDYRRNVVELGKIRATINSVKNDKDISLTSVWLKGFASPESPYAHNKDLAVGRTEALKNYIQQLYKFEEGVITTDYEPEDWTGLRKYVEQSDLEHRAEILALIDTEMDPDVKERKIKYTYPNEYNFLLENCYPALRHTDYRVAYIVRTYTDVEEMTRIMNEQPQKLDLNEFYLVAQKYEPGSEEFTQVFETAVRMFPNDEIANLNAANAAMRRGDLETAKRYLAKAGNSPEAIYANGAFAIRCKDYEAARRYLKEAKELGLEQAKVTLEQLENGRR